ncbi:peptidoglycan D,D-transpeptidase FtsI family protein [Thermoclostridium stercorarium]|nr:penicillin-binding transpeptidase domain-containing protein [Thermoclostridium stercorarium]
MRKGRVRLVLYIITALMACLVYRLYQIQVEQYEVFSSAAFRQRSRMTPVYHERGQIFDRNMIPFTDRTTEYVAVLQPAIFPRDRKVWETVADALKTSIEDFTNFSIYNASPVIYRIDEGAARMFIENPVKGVSIVERKVRTDKSMPAAHIVGYTDETGTQGMSGVEKAYQHILRSDNAVYAVATTDARYQYLEEYGYRLMESRADEPLSVKLTLDYHMQKLAEEVMDRMMVSGAVVVIDVLTGDILVLASRPGFNPANISEYLNDERQPLFNRAIAGYTPGSIFKIITTAAALEENFDPEVTFDCPGFIQVGEQVFKCWNYEDGGHGILNLTESFAQSCNSYFIHLGIQLGAEKMLDMAKKFGLGSTTGISEQLIPEYEGMLPDINELIGDGNIANLAMGQGKILVTPVQAAGMAAIIANGGIRHTFNIVDSIVNSEGEIVRDMKKREWKRVISRETATALMKMMEATVEYGTGKRADIWGYGGSAGKTGSAETGMFDDERQIIHAWFTGYFPYAEPKYAMCVFVEDGTGGGTSAAPVFAEIAARIMEWEESR